MAVTRSKRLLDANSNNVNLASSIKLTTSKKPRVSSVNKTVKLPISSLASNQLPKSPVKSKTKAAKLKLEDHLAENFIGSYSGDLPEEFERFHLPEFIDGCHHILKIDPSLYPAMVHQHFVQFENVSPEPLEAKEIIRSYWYALIGSIIGQQISGAAASAIELKFKALFGEQTPTPELTVELSHEQLRASGLSNQKVKYVQHISQHFLEEGNLTTVEFYETASVEDLINELVQLKGIGEWSAKMFVMFTLKNMDVFAYDDLGIARGMANYLAKRPSMLQQVKKECISEENKKALSKKTKFANKKDTKRDWVPIHDEYVKFVGEKFSPYQSIFMLLLWRISSTNINLLESSGIRYGNKPNPIKAE